MKKSFSNRISSHNQVAPIINAIMKYGPDTSAKNPIKILDAGCGRGMHSYMLRCIFENRLTIDALDIDYEKKWLPILKMVYDKVYSGSVLDLDLILTCHYNVIFCLHTLEHLQWRNAKKAIEQFQTHSDMVLIGVPARAQKPGKNYAKDDDPHTHKWVIDIDKETELNIYGFEKLNIPRSATFLWRKTT